MDAPEDEEDELLDDELLLEELLDPPELEPEPELELLDERVTPADCGTPELELLEEVPPKPPQALSKTPARAGKRSRLASIRKFSSLSERFMVGII